MDVGATNAGIIGRITKVDGPIVRLMVDAEDLHAWWRYH
jgi:hypothetical protein